MKPYPYPLPALIKDLREAALRASSQATETLNVGPGAWFRVFVYDPRGQIRWASKHYESKDLQEFEFIINAFNGKMNGWKCKLVYIVQRVGMPTVTTFKPLAFVTSGSKLRDGSVKVNISVSSLRQAARLARRSAARSLGLGKKTVSPWVPKGRNRPSPETKVQTFLNWRLNNGNISSQTYVNRIIYSRTWSGTVTPGFGKKKPSELPVNPHNVYIVQKSPGLWFEETTFSGPNPWATSDGGCYIDKLGTVQFGPSPGSCNHDTGADNKAISRLIDKTNAGVKANLAQDLAQISLTARTIADSLDRIISAAYAVRKKQFRSAAQILWSNGEWKVKKGRKPLVQNNMANNWLCYQYGWKPILQDITGSMEALSEYFNTASPVIRKTTASATTRRSTGGRTIYSSGPPVLVSGAWGESFVSTTRYTVDWTIDDRLIAFLQQTGFTNPINLLWEILPFSFVADWALPIGPYLESLTAFSGMRVLRGCKTQFTKVETNYIHYYEGIAPGYTDSRYRLSSAGAHSERQVRLTRSQVQSWPSMTRPALKDPSSLIHALNSWALVQQVFAPRKLR